MLNDPLEIINSAHSISKADHCFTVYKAHTHAQISINKPWKSREYGSRESYRKVIISYFYHGLFYCLSYEAVPDTWKYLDAFICKWPEESCQLFKSYLCSKHLSIK